MKFIDYYKVLNLDHNWSCEQIMSQLRTSLKQWKKRNNCCSSDKKEQLDLISEMLKYITEAMAIFRDDLARQKYDNELNDAYANGVINDELEKEYEDLVAKADAYYYAENYDLAIQFAKEAVEAQINNSYAYELLAKCYMLKNDYVNALDSIDKGCNIFANDISLIQMGARIATISGQMYDEAQRRINIILEKYPEKPVGFAEQIYMHLFKGDFELAFSEVDSYVAARPQDIEFRKLVAYDFIKYIQDNYIYPTEGNQTMVAGKEAYQKGLKLARKAVNIYSDQHTKAQLEYMEFFGQREFDKWNLDSIKTLTIYGTVMLIIPPIGIVFLLIDILLIVFSFRPYWQINETHLTGQKGQLESIVHKIGYHSAKLSLKAFYWTKKLTLAFFKFVIWLATGGPFK